MNVTEFTYLMNKPDAVNDKHTAVLEKIVQEFPYFQSARALYLKGLYNQNSFKYNHVLKITAAHTVDRSVLFDFISSENFIAVQKELYDQKLSEILNIIVKDSEIVIPEARPEPKPNTLEQSILTSIKEATPETETVVDDLPEETIADSIDPEILPEVLPSEPTEEVQNLQLGKPLPFTRDEKHSFQEWLQLSKVKPIDRETPENRNSNSFEEDSEKQKKNQLIDRFIEASPKIPPVKHDAPLPQSIIFEPSKADNSYLMTETLARVYLEQKKYQKAIQAYEILILKYPEKSSFFADRILDIKNLQQNNK